MAKPSVEDLYKAFSVIHDHSNKSDPEVLKAFSTIINGAKSGNAEKRLASQFIVRFFKDMATSVQELAFNEMINLCEDDDIQIRKQTIKDFPLLCKGSSGSSYVGKIADILTQLLQVSDPQELICVQQSLHQVMDYDVHGTLTEMFNQVLAGVKEKGASQTTAIARQRALKFLADKIKSLPEDAIKPDMEQLLQEGVTKVIKDVPAEEFVHFISILSSLKSMNNLIARQNLVNMISEQACFKADFQPKNAANYNQVTMCTKEAIRHLSKNVTAEVLLAYFCDKVMPKLGEVPSLPAVSPPPAPVAEPVAEPATEKTEGEAEKKTVAKTTETAPTPTVRPLNKRLEILQLLAKLSEHHGTKLTNVATHLAPLYKQLYEMLPSDVSEETPEQQQELEDGLKRMPELGAIVCNGEDALRLQEAECLLFSFHHLSKLEPDFLTSDAERLKNFRQSLTIFVRKSQSYAKVLNASVAGKEKSKLIGSEFKLRRQVLMIIENVTAITRDFFRNPPTFNSLTFLSFAAMFEDPVKDAAKRAAAGELSSPVAVKAAKLAAANRAAAKSTAKA